MGKGKLGVEVGRFVVVSVCGVLGFRTWRKSVLLGEKGEREKGGEEGGREERGRVKRERKREKEERETKNDVF